MIAPAAKHPWPPARPPWLGVGLKIGVGLVALAFCWRP